MAFSTRRVSPYDAWRIFTTMRLHFTPLSKYDAVQYNFKFRSCAPSAFANKGDSVKYAFEKFARAWGTEDALIRFYLANFLDGKTWMSQFEEEPWRKFQGEIDAFGYKFAQTAKLICEVANDFDEFFKLQDDRPPDILVGLRQGTIPLLHVAVLDIPLGFTKDIERLLVNDPMGLIANDLDRIKKMKPFVLHLVDIEKMKKILIKTFTSDAE